MQSHDCSSQTLAFGVASSWFQVDYSYIRNTVWKSGLQICVSSRECADWFLGTSQKEFTDVDWSRFFKCWSWFQVIWSLSYAIWSAGEDPGLQNVAAELFEIRISYLLSTCTSKLLGSFHHRCNKNGWFLFSLN